MMKRIILHVNSRTTIFLVIVLMTRVCGVSAPVENGPPAAAATNAPLPALTEPRDGATIFFVGDSITQHGTRQYGYVTQLEMALAGAYPTRRIRVGASGVGFNDSQDVRKRLKHDVLERDPTIVVVEIGLADLYYSEKRPIDKEMFRFAMQDIIWQIRRAGTQPVLMTLTLIGERFDGSNELDPVIDEYSEAIRELAHAQRCPLIDIRSEFIAFLKRVNPDNVKSGILTPEGDGVHLNYYGNRLLANLILEAFQVPLADDWRDRLAREIERAKAPPEEKVISP